MTKKKNAQPEEHSPASEDTLEQLAELRDRMINASETDQNIVSQWEKLFRRAMLVRNLYEHDAIKILYEYASLKVGQIDAALQGQTAEELSNSTGLWKRAKLEAEKSAFQWFASIFKKAEDTIKVINKSVKDNIIN